MFDARRFCVQLCTAKYGRMCSNYCPVFNLILSDSENIVVLSVLYSVH